MARKPALALAAVPGQRNETIELAREIESRGYAGIYCASFGDGLGLCLSMAHATTTIPIGTSIANIYGRNPFEMATQAAYIHEISDGRFTLGLGVSHGPTHERMGVAPGKPLSDMREYVERMREAASSPMCGPLPPIVLATLRKKMVALAVEIADGAVWANASRSHMGESLAEIPALRREGGFFIGDMIPTCIDDDREAAAKVMRRTLSGYVALPNYRNYWKEAGYVEEMEAIEAALAAGDRERLPGLMTDRWLSDATLYGSKQDVLAGVEAWYDAGVKTPIVVPSSTKGRQFKAFEEVFEAFA